MRVFLTGATGFIGSAIIPELLAAGHQVTGLVRSDAGARALVAAGVQVQHGALDDLEGLRRGAAAADGVIHTAFIHDFKDMAAAGRTDLNAITAFGAALAGSDRPLVVTSGTAHLPAGRSSTEEDAPDANAPARHRIPSEEATLALAARGVRACLIRLPLSVHGEGDHGFVPALIGVARATGVSAYIGDGMNRWPAVHRLDAARLFRLALEKGSAGARYHGIADQGIPVREIAQVIGRRLQLPVASRSPQEADGHFGWLATFIVLDRPSSSTLTQQRLGWKPVHAGLLSDLDRPAYFAS